MSDNPTRRGGAGITAAVRSPEKASKLGIDRGGVELLPGFDVTAPADVQKSRVLSRPGMTEQQFERLLSRQMPDAEKRNRADHIIETLTLDDTRAAVRDLIAELTGRKDA